MAFIYIKITISTAPKIIKLSLWMNVEQRDIKLLIVFKEEGNRK